MSSLNVNFWQELDNYVTFDSFFAMLIRVTGWLLGVYVIISGKVDGTQTVALILAFIGFELVSRAKEKALPELIERKRRNGQTG